jgi:hypothetical protein
MAEIKLQKRKVPFWPWLVGLAVAGIIILGISRLVTSKAINQIDEDSTTVTDAGAAGGPATGDTPPPPLPSSSLEALLPLGTEDLGQRVAVNGEVVGAPSAEGFWVLTDENVVIFVRGAPPAKLGAREENLMGQLTAAKPAEADGWEAAAKLKEARGWIMTRDMFVRVGAVAAKDSTKAAAKGAAKGKKPATKLAAPAKPTGKPGAKT